eukprot:scaffold9352_cov57-Phaeocystis_antarctica.AAC.7
MVLRAASSGPLYLAPPVCSSTLNGRPGRSPRSCPRADRARRPSARCPRATAPTPPRRRPHHSAGASGPACAARASRRSAATRPPVAAAPTRITPPCRRRLPWCGRRGGGAGADVWQPTGAGEGLPHTPRVPRRSRNLLFIQRDGGAIQLAPLRSCCRRHVGPLYNYTTMPNTPLQHSLYTCYTLYNLCNTPLPAPRRGRGAAGRQTDRQTDRQFGRKTHSKQLGCCATHLRRHNSAPDAAACAGGCRGCCAAACAATAAC